MHSSLKQMNRVRILLPLEGLLEGSSNRAIGKLLGISEGAVKAALHRVFAKAQVRTRGQLVRLVVEAEKPGA